MDCSDQQLSIDDAIKLFVNHDFSSIPTSFDPEYIENSSLCIFEPTKVKNIYIYKRKEKLKSGYKKKTNVTVDITLLFTALIGNCCKEVKLGLDSLPAFLERLIQAAIETSRDTRRFALSKIVASIVNKWTNGKQ